MVKNLSKLRTTLSFENITFKNIKVMFIVARRIKLHTQSVLAQSCVMLFVLSMRRDVNNKIGKQFNRNNYQQQ